MFFSTHKHTNNFFIFNHLSALPLKVGNVVLHKSCLTFSYNSAVWYWVEKLPATQIFILYSCINLLKFTQTINNWKNNKHLFHKDCGKGDGENTSNEKSGQNAIWFYVGKRNSKCAIKIQMNFAKLILQFISQTFDFQSLCMELTTTVKSRSRGWVQIKCSPTSWKLLTIEHCCQASRLRTAKFNNFGLFWLCYIITTSTSNSTLSQAT